ncbi:MAG: Permease of the drug/metabolite transporter (DMT) superfamily [uncultured Thermomicrobiales bacterium]|uniref:Permease of the drug/metabolite transporter (DMT) superfamily n=1 Tax=uncultured Thermomicrobiales bacterium TaxID=1645740 RepID=A0A6J4UVC3_9BACT|nr:MAG: Permease of the drug/metabolite transporter (DMT) superfamily [uncultured Thermomicrobiales bacterium]
MGRWQLLGVHAQLLFTAMVWGGQFVALQIALRELRVLDMLLARTLLAAGFYAVLLSAIARHEGRFVRPARDDWPRLALVALLGVPGAGLGVMSAQRYISADVASLITVTGPIFTALAAFLLLGQRLNRPQVGGIALAIGGFLLLLLLGGKGARFEVRNMLGVLLMASSPLCWAFFTVLGKSLVMRYGSARATGYVMLTGAAYLAPLLSPRFVRDLLALSWRGWGSILFSGLVATSVTYLLWNRALRVLQPAQVAVYIYLVPVFGILAAAIVLGDRPTPWAGLAGLIILAGVVVTNRGARQEPPLLVSSPGTTAARAPDGAPPPLAPTGPRRAARRGQVAGAPGSPARVGQPVELGEPGSPNGGG